MRTFERGVVGVIIGMLVCGVCFAEGDNGGGRTFAGLNFGVGISLTDDFGGDRRVKAAVLENGVVRVTEDENTKARVMLETHYFFQPLNAVPEECVAKEGEISREKRNSKDCVRARADLRNDYSPDARKNWGWGPFVALQPGTDEIIDAIGGGIMVGFKRGGREEQGGVTNSSFNIGLGVAVDTSVQILGDGFRANEPAPVDEDGEPLAIRYRKTDQWAVLALASFTFE